MSSLPNRSGIEAMSRPRKKECGAFFTPYPIASDMIKTHKIHLKWAEGASVLDPTAGDGSLLEALIRCTLEENIPVTKSMLSRLKGFEKEEVFCRGFQERIQKNYDLLPGSETLECRDFLKVEPLEYDILFGNPPWLNFTDINEDEKEGLKEYFVRYGLTEGGKGLLLGSARIDLAALIIQKALQDHLVSHGKAYFFIPLSLMLNEGAHNAFRKGKLQNSHIGGTLRDTPRGSGTISRNSEPERFSFEEIRDFSDFQIFPEVSTRCGFISLQKSSDQINPVPYFTMTAPGRWKSEKACPVGKAGSAYMITDDENAPPLIRIHKDSRPRQGINTGGRNSLFIFTSYERLTEGLCRVQNKSVTAVLPQQLVYPLINREQFKGLSTPVKYIFLPYNRDSGRILTLEELQSFPEALSYILSRKESLAGRKGTLMGVNIKKGLYWGLLGVGPYSFSPWKIVWEAYGRSEFKPRLFACVHEAGDKKPWIPNQALQASCSFKTKEEALRVLKALENPAINRILKRQNMEGTCNWAQPGRIRHFLIETA